MPWSDPEDEFFLDFFQYDRRLERLFFLSAVLVAEEFLWNGECDEEASTADSWLTQSTFSSTLADPKFRNWCQHIVTQQQCKCDGFKQNFYLVTTWITTVEKILSRFSHPWQT